MSLLPTRNDYANLALTWRSDLVAGMTVGVVALPLALAFGVSSGLGAAAGLTTAIVAGIIAALFGGSHLQVSGPTGAMTVVLIPVVAEYGAEGALVVTLLAGVVLGAAAWGGVGRYVAFIPWPVIEGFTVGIAVIIFLQEVPSALGVTSAGGGEQTLAAAWDALRTWGGSGWVAPVIAALVAIIMIVLPRLHRALPASLIGVGAATVLTGVWNLQIPRIGSIPSSLPLPHLPNVQLGELAGLASPVLAIAALAAIESLLSAKVADGMSDADDHDPNRELLGQGLANIGSSLFGGMPATGAIARTAVNVRAGGRTRASSLTHGLVLLLIMLLLAPVVGQIPLAALAGVLMVTAVRMVEFGTVRRLLRSTRGDALVLVVTALTTISFDLVVAVEVGIVLASFLALRAVALSSSFKQESNSRRVDVDSEAEHVLLHEHIVTYRLDGALFFGAAQRFLLELTEVADVKVVILRLGQIQVLDATGAQALGDIVEHLQHRGITVLLCSVRPWHLRLIEGIGVLDALTHAHHVLPTIDEALTYAHEIVTGVPRSGVEEEEAS